MNQLADRVLGRLLAVSRAIDATSTAVGRNVAWLLVAAAVISASNAIVRKLFDVSSNAWLEVQWVLFGAAFLLAAPWTLLLDEHIRIDIVSQRLGARTRDLIEIAGLTLFLIPMALAVLLTSLPFVARTLPGWADIGPALWLPSLGRLMALGEQSSNAGGLPLWPAKLLIPMGFGLLLAQGISELIKRLAIMRGILPRPERGSAHPALQELQHDPRAGGVS